MAVAIRIDNPDLDAYNARQEQADEKVRQLESQVDAIAKATVDAVADTRTMRVVALEPGDRPAIESVRIEVNGSGPRISITENAHNQIAEKLDIPKQYYQRMLKDQPGLLAVNINRWFQAEPNQHLLRMLSDYAPMIEMQARTETNFTLRSFLGASYRPLDNAQLLQTVIPAAREKGALLAEFSLTEQRLHAKFLTEQRDVQQVITEVGARMGLTYEEARKRHVIDQNEIVEMGVYLRNSETGFASLDVSGVMRVLKCLNSYIAEAATKVRHVGKRQQVEEGDLNWLSSQTQRLDNAAIFSRVRDTVLAALNEQKMLDQATKLATAKATIIETKVPTFEFVGNIADKYDLTEREVEVLNEEVVRARVEEGGFTQFALSQGFTALARQTDDFDRRVELERAGWNIISQDTAKLLAAGK